MQWATTCARLTFYLFAIRIADSIETHRLQNSGTISGPAVPSWQTIEILRHCYGATSFELVLLLKRSPGQLAMH